MRQSRRTVRPKRWLRISLHACTATLIVVSLTGCLKQMLFLGLLIHGPPSIEPDFDDELKISFVITLLTSKLDVRCSIE